MLNPWLQVEDFDEEDDGSDVFMGVFTRPPAEIAASLPRPPTPFNFQASPQTLPPIQTKLSSISLSRSMDVESPVIHSRPQPLFTNSLVTVF